MRVATMAACLVLTAAPASAGDYLDRLYEAGPDAAGLLLRKAADWRRADATVKDRVGFMIFQRDFPRKHELSQDEMIACIDDLAAKVEPTRAVEAMINECGGAR